MISKNLDHHLSSESRSRLESPLKTAFKYFGRDDIVFLGGGLPLSDYFPWNKVTVESPQVPFSKGIGHQPVTAAETLTTEIYKDAKLAKANFEKEVPLSRSLQYGHTLGQPELVSFLKEHTKLIHGVQYDDWEIIVNTGNTQGWDNVLRNFCDRGDAVLVEQYSFSSSLEAARAQGVVTFPVEMDAFGIVPEKLEALMAGWKGKKPKLLYTIPTGQNPTGSSLSKERRVQIYKIAQKYDFLIVEDEPYYFLQIDPYVKKEDRKAIETKEHKEFIKCLVPSFLSLDTEGRVLRLDSCSKTLAPGSRIGWITGRAKFIERFARLQEVSAQTPSGFSSSIIGGTLNRWGQEGYLDWLIKMREEYTIKRDVTADTIYKCFPKEVTFNPPVAGMFFTIEIDASKHPKYAELKDPLKVETLLFDAAVAKGSLMIPGSWFVVKGQTEPKQDYEPEKSTKIFFRGTYAATPLDVLQTGLERFAEAVKEEFHL